MEELGDVEDEAEQRMDRLESYGTSLDSTLKVSYSIPQSEPNALEKLADSEQRDAQTLCAAPNDHQSVDRSVVGDGDESGVATDASQQVQEAEDQFAEKAVSDSKGSPSASDVKKHVLARSLSEDFLSSPKASRSISLEGQLTRSCLPLSSSSPLSLKASSLLSELRSEIQALKAKHKAGVQAAATLTKQVEQEVEPASSLLSVLDQVPEYSEQESSVLPDSGNNDDDNALHKVKVDNMQLHESMDFDDEAMVPTSATSHSSSVASDEGVPAAERDESLGVTSSNEVESFAGTRRGLPLFEDIEKTSFSAEDFFSDSA